MLDHNRPLALDPKGDNPINRITEAHKLSEYDIHVITPRLGSYYGDSVIVECKGVVLQKGSQYKCIELHQDATITTGQPVYNSILITDNTLTGFVKVVYQAVGGEYRYNLEDLHRSFDTVQNDNRDVHWRYVDGVPDKLPPAIHRHYVDDFSGFQHIADYLDRIEKSIILHKTHIMHQIVSTAQISPPAVDCPTIRKNLPTLESIGYDGMLYLLSQYKLIGLVSVDTVNCYWDKGGIEWFSIDTSNVEVGTTLYWELYTPNEGVNIANYFPIHSGTLISNGEPQLVSIMVPHLTNVNMFFDIYIGVRLDPNKVDYDAVSFRIDFSDNLIVFEIDGIYPTLVYGSPDEEFLARTHKDIEDTDPETRLYYQTFY